MSPDRNYYSTEQELRESEVIVLIPSIIHSPRLILFDTRQGGKTGPTFIVDDLTKHVPQMLYSAFTRNLFSTDDETCIKLSLLARGMALERRPDLPAPKNVAIIGFDYSKEPFPTTPKWQLLLEILGEVFRPEYVQDLIGGILQDDHRDYLVELVTGNGPGTYFWTLWQG